MNTVNRRKYLGLIVLWLLTGVCFAVDTQEGPFVGEAGFEDLSACKMSHGIVKLPRKNSSSAIKKSKGYIYNFENESLAYDPFLAQGDEAGDFRKLFDMVVKKKTGDLYYDYGENKLFFFSFSGRIKDLGAHFLHEFNNKKLSTPGIASYTEEGETFKGVLMDVQAGHCYLMTTLSKEWVLLRVIAVDKRAEFCTIQWVRRPAGEKFFKIPKGTITEAKEPLQPKYDPREMTSQGSEKIQELQVAAENFFQETRKLLAERDKRIKECIAILKIPEKDSASQIEKLTVRGLKVFALHTLGVYRASEAAPLLASMVDTRISSNISPISDSASIESPYGCPWVLEQIGKPGAAACINELINLNPADRGKTKENLLIHVILGVEGVKVAELLFNEELKKASGDIEKTKNIERALQLIKIYPKRLDYKTEG